jgi:hypothetical protein
VLSLCPLPPPSRKVKLARACADKMQQIYVSFSKVRGQNPCGDDDDDAAADVMLYVDHSTEMLLLLAPL